MDRLDAAGANAAPLTADQQAQLKKLHTAAQQLEGVFVDLLFKEMRKSQPEVSLTGKVSPAEKTFSDMLDEKRADQLAQSGSLGIGKIIEQQLRDQIVWHRRPGGPGDVTP